MLGICICLGEISHETLVVPAIAACCICGIMIIVGIGNFSESVQGAGRCVG